MKKLLAGVIIAVAVVALVIIIGTSSFVYSNASFIVSNINKQQQNDDLKLEKQIHDQINKERTVVDLPALSWNEDAAVKARAWAKHLYETNTFEHSSTFCMGENILDMKGSFTAQEAVSQWMNSHEHRDNIRNPSYGSEGIGIYQTIIVENFC